jgi:Tol biopolymer transport system component
MGEVYRARDSKLNRDVAIKVLPEVFARDPDRMARFQREAKILASLNHPNIATIHGLEDSGSTHALVMELVEGSTLADRIKQGPIPIEESLRIGKQVCEALEYAHERGIIHRDLKPANVKVTADDAVKVLDFGLAKAMEGEAASLDVSTSPTLSRMATMQGVLLGTAAYMSPEQAKAKPVDRRADIWVFGCVLYEMLTGKQTFTGETVTDTLAAVIKEEPNWSRLPTGTPMRVRVLLQRCLQKDPKRRLQAIGDARISLDEVLSGAPEALPSAAVPLPSWRGTVPWAIAVVSALGALVLAIVHFGAKPTAPTQLLRYEIFPPEKAVFGTNPASVSLDFALSPDGRHLAFAAATQGQPTQLWVRDLDSLESKPLPGTEGAGAIFWSPDSGTVAFQAGNRLERVDISGGAPQAICPVGRTDGGSWNREGVILFGSYDGLMVVSAAGGTPSVLMKPDRARGEFSVAGASFLPDGRHFFYNGLTASSRAYIGSLDPENNQERGKPLVAGYPVVYVPSPGAGSGRVLFRQADGTLMTQTFDASRMELEGDPVAIAQGVTNFTVSDNGVLAYSGGAARTFQLTWFDRQGKPLGTLGEPDVVPTIAISPDDSAVALPRSDGDLWLYDVANGTRSRLTFDGKTNQLPVWSPDGSHLAFLSTREVTPRIYEKAINGMGQEEALDRASTGTRVPLDWSRDGRYPIEGYGGKQMSIWVMPLSSVETAGRSESVPYLNDEGFNEVSARLSPNGEWIAYDTDETGRDEIFVQTFPKPGGKWQASTSGGTRPVWSRDGRELYFIGLDGKLMAVDVKGGAGGTFEGGAPKALFDTHTIGDRLAKWDVSKDGRFLIPVAAQYYGDPITVVVNWPSLLKK